MSKVTIVNYDIGNILSVKRAFEHCGADVLISRNADEIKKSERIIVPGVGAFNDCVTGLENYGLKESVMEFAASGRPYLGICVGMQMMMEESEEFGLHKGLGYLKGSVVKITEDVSENKKKYKVPFIGWKPLKKTHDTPLLKNISDNDRFYFIHSFKANPKNKSDLLAYYNYNGIHVSAIIGKNNMFGTQFHPEKSGEAGLHIIRNFLKI